MNIYRRDELEQMLEFIKKHPQVLNSIDAEGDIMSNALVRYILGKLHGLNQNKDD